MTIIKPRESGFYWVKFQSYDAHGKIPGVGEWSPAEYDDGEWWVLGGDMAADPQHFLEISPRLEPPK